jgi:hypothetical protein
VLRFREFQARYGRIRPDTGSLSEGGGIMLADRIRNFFFVHLGLKAL